MAVEGLSCCALKKGRGFDKLGPNVMGRYGKSGDRSIEPGPRPTPGPGPALREACGAAPDEEARDRASAAPDSAPEGFGGPDDLLDMRQCRYLGSLFDLPRSAAGREIALRGRRGCGPLGARSLAPLPGPLPCARRPPLGARRRPTGGPQHRCA